MIKSIQVLGAGGAFDTHMTNSAFYVTTTFGVILVDCGYNVFSRLKELEQEDNEFIKRITHIIITHNDDDHIGSLKSLLYYRYFILNKSTKVLGMPALIDYLQNMNSEIKGSKTVYAEMCTTELLSSFSLDSLKIKTYSLPTNHHEEGKSIILKDEANNIIAISGDTKANSAFEEKIKVLSTGIPGRDIVFHDYSYWNAVSRQTHACKNDCLSEYSEQFLNTTIMYHNNSASCEHEIYTIPFSPVITDMTLQDAINDSE